MSSNQDLPIPVNRDPRPKAFRADIQGLRAIAVGIVVLYHFWGHYLPGGFVGVDVFFVISGFLITSHLIAKPPKKLADVAQFWMRRVKRLAPGILLGDLHQRHSHLGVRASHRLAGLGIASSSRNLLLPKLVPGPNQS